MFRWGPVETVLYGWLVRTWSNARLNGKRAGLYTSPTPLQYVFNFNLLLAAKIRSYGCEFSTACATLRAIPSSKCLPRIWTPIGRPSFVFPQGTETPQIPASDAATV